MAKSKKTKIHKKIDGQLLQMNKKFSNLKVMKDIVSMIQKPKRMRIRDIPMTQMVYDVFRKQRELNLMLGLQSNVEIGGRSGFIFNTKHGRPIMPAGVNSFLKNIVNTYNKKESKLAEEENREPELMSPISSHTLRHTGCTRLGEDNVNPKVMQYVMGHSDAQITMNVYNHIAEKSHVENEMSKMNLPETVPAVV